MRILTVLCLGLLSLALSACQPAVNVTPSVSTSPVVTPQHEQIAAETIAKPTLVDQTAEEVPAPELEAELPQQIDPSDEFFQTGRIPTLKIQLTQQEEQKLRADERRFVECVLIEDDGTTYKKVAVKLKGAAGSFRGFDDRPAFTLKMKKKGERFHGLDKFYLNNSVQDESYLCELLGSQLCREAGLPAPRVTHARVLLGTRDLGLYVFKEGYDDTFLERNFPNPKGNLYDGGFCIDIDSNLEKDEGEGPDDRSDLQALLAACREGDDAKRTALIAERLDVEAFLNFTALELMLCHWDGYVQNRNNYRIYFRPNDSRAVFLPHGLDQLFQDSNYPVFVESGQIVAGPVLRNPQWKTMYRQRVKQLLPLFETDKLHAKINAAHERVRPVVAKMGEDRAKHFDHCVQDLKNRVAARAVNIRNQFGNLPPEPLLFTDVESHVLEDWLPRAEGDTILVEREVAGKQCYVMETGPSKQAVASWRRKVLLARGRYCLEAVAQVADVKAIEDGRGKGFGLRLSGGQRENHLTGSTKWENVVFAFEISEDSREVELVAEFRATGGSVAIQKGSLKIVQIK